VKGFSLVVLLALLSFAVAALVVTFPSSSTSSTCAQESDGGAGGPPPVGEGPDSNDSVLVQIAQVIQDKQQQGQVAGEQDLRALTEQLTGATSITLGGDAVGGVAELPSALGELAEGSHTRSC
jgi:hypothetical protein